MDMNVFAKENDLARKFEAALQEIENGKGWKVFKGLDEGECQVRITYDGRVIFHPVLKPERAKKEKVKPEPFDTPTGEPIITELVDDSLDVALKKEKRSRKKEKDESS